MKYMNSIAYKWIIALTGWAWALFVMTHMIGNMLIFVGAKAYNTYSHFLVSNPLIYIAEAGLVLTILGHSFTGLFLFFKNRYCSKPLTYSVKPTRNKGASFSSQSMAYTGSFMLAFLITHLITFKYGSLYMVKYEDKEMRDIFRLVVEVFNNPNYVIWYIISLFFVGVHLSHGVSSGFQSLGLIRGKSRDIIRIVGYFYAIIVALGFMAQPIFVYFFYRG